MVEQLSIVCYNEVFFLKGSCTQQVHITREFILCYCPINNPGLYSSLHNKYT